MTDTPNAPVEQSADLSQLQSELDALRRKNRELLDEKKQLGAKIKDLPEGLDVSELVKFKQDHERKQLESAGEYDKAREALQQQFNEITTQLRTENEALKARIRDLELISPASSELAKIVHDPDDVFKTGRLKPEQIESDPVAGPVVVNGLERTPIADWARSNLPKHYLREPQARGSGAPVGGSSAVVIPPGTVNPLARDSFNLTEAARLAKVNPELYAKFKAEAARQG
jgi:cell division protein FtsB